MFKCKKFLCCVASSIVVSSPIFSGYAYCSSEEASLEKYFRAKIKDYISSKNLSEEEIEEVKSSISECMDFYGKNQN